MDEKELIVAGEENNSKPKPRRERRGLSYYFTAGIIMSLLDKLTNAIYEALIGGFFGKIFTAYSSEQRALEGGYLNEYMFGSGALNKYSRTIRGWLSEKIENGFVLWSLKKLGGYFMSTPLKVYGNYLLTFGLYTVFSYFVRRFTEFSAAPDYSLIIFGAILVIAAMPLLLSKDSLGGAIGSSRSARALFVDCFGFRDESFEVTPRSSRFRANAAIVFGIISGTLALLIDPIYVVLALVLASLAALIIITPEIGVLVSLFALPFFSFADNPSLMLGLLMSLTVIGAVVKLIRGKRIIKIELLDIAVIIFMAILFLSGAVSAGGTASLGEALLACTLLLVYFLVANMMRSELWIKRCVIALVSSATVVSIIGIVEYLFGELSLEWIDTEYFSDIPGRVVSLFDNSNVLAFYLVMIFPFALDLFFRCKTNRERFLSSFANLSIILCVVFAFSRGAWLAIILCTVLYMLIRTRRSFKALVWICFAIPVLPIVLPSSIVNRFLSIGDMADSSTFYRVYTWRGSIRAALEHFFSGIGYGNAAFEEVYPSYAYAGMESAEHAHSLFLQIWLGMGIIGLAVFLVMIFLFSQKTLEYIKKPESQRSACLVTAALSSLVSALVMGAFDHIWYNYRVFFLFWVVMGIATAAVRVGQTKMVREGIRTVSSTASADVDIF